MFQHFTSFPHMLRIFACVSHCFQHVAFAPHMFRICCAFSAPAHFFRIVCTIVPHIFRICSACVSQLCAYFAHFQPPRTFSAFVSHLFPHVFEILSSEKRIVFRILCAFRICCAYLRASQNTCFRISKFPNMTRRFHRLGVAIVVVVVLLLNCI
jgi:hypothetical protein